MAARDWLTSGCGVERLKLIMLPERRDQLQATRGAEPMAWGPGAETPWLVYYYYYYYYYYLDE